MSFGAITSESRIAHFMKEIIQNRREINLLPKVEPYSLGNAISRKATNIAANSPTSCHLFKTNRSDIVFFLVTISFIRIATIHVFIALMSFFPAI